MVEQVHASPDGNATTVRVPPYVSYSTFKTFLGDLRDHGVPRKIDRSVWGTRVSGSVGVQLMSTLRFLRLVGTDDRPEPTLEPLVKLFGTDAWNMALKNVIAQAYEPIVALELTGMTYEHLFIEFRTHYGAQDSVLGKSVRFFIQAAQEAGIDLGGRIVKGARKDRTRGGTRSNMRNRSEYAPLVQTPPSAQSVARPETPIQVLIDILDTDDMEKGEQDAVWTLIRYLKRKAQACSITKECP